MIVPFTFFVSSLAVITGMLAIGTGSHWNFTGRDIVEGKANAVLYVWVIFSSIFSLIHSGKLAEYGLEWGWQPRVPETMPWIIAHTAVAIFLVSAHIFVSLKLRSPGNAGSIYLWGKRSHEQQS